MNLKHENLELFTLETRKELAKAEMVFKYWLYVDYWHNGSESFKVMLAICLLSKHASVHYIFIVC